MPEFPSTPLREPPPPGVTRLFLIRHGSTPPNEHRPFVLQGCEINGSLSELGRQQASWVGQYLSAFQIHAVYASSMQRAIETAEFIARPHGLSVAPVHDLRECSVGEWEGKSWTQIREETPQQHDDFFADPVLKPHPGGESYGDLLRRVRPALQGILEQHPGENVVVVAHNLVNRVYLAEHVGIDLKHARKLRQMNCCINLLHHYEGETELVTLNSVLHHEFL